MNNFASHIGEVKAKHGVFSFCHFDEYIGLSLREYGEFSEIELSLMSKFIMKDDVVFDIHLLKKLESWVKCMPLNHKK